MGQKVHPNGMRLGLGGIRKSHSIWFPANNVSFAETLHSDIAVRRIINARLPAGAGISKIKIERSGNNIKIALCTAKPGVVIGKKGADVEKLRLELAQKTGCGVHINIEEIRKPDIESVLVARGVAGQLEKRIMFRRAMKRAVSSAMRAGAKGIKIMVAGRLGGAEIARTEWYREGRVPLHTFRADIDYATAEANTTYGIIGVKVWIYKGEIFAKKSQDAKGK